MPQWLLATSTSICNLCKGDHNTSQYLKLSAVLKLWHYTNSSFSIDLEPDNKSYNLLIICFSLIFYIELDGKLWAVPLWMQFSLRWKKIRSFHSQWNRLYSRMAVANDIVVWQHSHCGNHSVSWESLEQLFHWICTSEKHRRGGKISPLLKRAHCPEQSIHCSLLVQVGICNHNKVIWTRHQQQSILSLSSCFWITTKP